MSTGTTKLCSITILVKDLDRAIQNREQTPGIKAGESFYLPPASEVPAFTHFHKQDR
jgi:hypothetical protein